MRTWSALALLWLVSCDGAPSDPDAGPPAGIDAGVDAGPEPVAQLPEPGRAALVTHDDGRADLADDAGTMYLRGLWAEALYREGDAERTVQTSDCPGAWAALDAAWSDAPRFADGAGQVFTCETSDGVGLTWRLWLDRAHDALLADVTVRSVAGGPERTALRLTPLITEGAEGGVFLGTDVARHRILDNGADVVRETEAYLHYPEERRSPLLSAVPIESRGDIVANWNAAVADLEGGRHLIVGALAVERGLPTFGLSARTRPLDAITGRRGFGALYADSVLVFEGKPLHPGGSIASETVYADALARDPLVGLEAYAEAVAAFEGVTVWTRREGGRRVPNGWNSWSGGGSSGGLGTNIDEALMRENLAIMARELAPFGVDYFQIDDGYQDHSGDWGSDLERFPGGVDGFAAEIEAAGLAPGIWIQAFLVDEESDLAAAHPDWLHDPADAALGSILSPSPGLRAVDLGNDAVTGWLGDLMRRYREDWGMRWLKLDFSYLAFPYTSRANPELTSVEAYRRGLRAIHDALGPDVFFLGIGMVGMNYGIVDGMRLTLDDGPIWEEPSPLAPFGAAGTLKSSVRTGSRRYYLHGRLWISHDDLLFFRTAPDHPELTLDEATTFASFIAMSGSIVKLGEDLRTLTPPQIQVVRRLLPSYPTAGRPLDLFTRNYPEIWHYPIDGTLAGSSAAWEVVGLLHWGRNYDFSVDGAPPEMADEARTYSVPLADLGLDPDADYLAQEFWTEAFLGTVRGTLTQTVAPHGHAVIALRPALDHPQLLGSNRHVTQGATDLIEETWDDATRTLTVRLQVDAGAADAIPFEYRVRIHAPDGFVLDAAGASGGAVEQDGEVVTVTFTPDAPGERALVVPFG
ncbi:MAG: alpha-galactosidase [Sandaracinaceae bacterium]|nr:alpha-galactosidase [Sandaracinaceae bacterium]